MKNVSKVKKINMRNQQRLAAAFKAPPHEYVFVGRDRKVDKCACGQHISVRFHVQHPQTKHALILGCDCIETYDTLGAIKGQVDAFLAAEKAAEKAAIEAEACKALDQLVTRWEGVRIASNEAYKVRAVSWGAWNERNALQKALVAPKVANLKTTKGKIKAYEKAIAKLQAAAAAYSQKCREIKAAHEAEEAKRAAEAAALQAS